MSRKWFLMRRMPIPKAAPTLLHQKKAYSFIVQKQHVSTGLSLRPKENVPAFFLAEKSIFLKKHARAHTHTHTHVSLPLPKFISPEKPRSFSGILGSQEIMETLAHWEGSRALCHTHTHRVTWRLTAGRTLCVFPRIRYPLCTPTRTWTYIREETCPPPTKSVALGNQASFFLVLGLQKICLQMENAFFF